MALTERELQVYREIREWKSKLVDYEANDFEMMYEKSLERSFSLLPQKVQQQFFSSLDSWLFHLHALIQGSQLQIDAKQRILTAARIFQPEIMEISDLKNLKIDQLQYIAQQQIARHRLYSMVQGGMTGTGNNIMLGTDIPAMAVINLRVVQLIAIVYGNEVNTPFEMMQSLRVFHAASLPPRMQGRALEELIAEFDAGNDVYFYEGKEELTDITWMEQPLKQILKGIAILLFRKKTLQDIPIISMAIGAGANYQFTRRVTEFSLHYYQYKYLQQKKGD